MADAPPFYRRTNTRLNPNSSELSLKNEVGAPNVILSGDAVDGDGPYTIAFGDVAGETTLDMFLAWDNSAYNPNKTLYPRVFLGVYEGDAGAFKFEGSDLTPAPDIFPVMSLPSSLNLGNPGWASRITATAADAGVEKTGKFTLYFEVAIVDGAPQFRRAVAEINLSKTYVP